MTPPRSRRVRYGPSRGQFSVVRRSRQPGAPIVVLLHGGFWRWPYNRWLMLRLVRDVTARGWACVNVEYRRLGRFGGGGRWPHIVEDVEAALEQVIEICTAAGRPDSVTPPIVVVGHSAGAHLAMVACARNPGLVDAVVSMAGPTDLRRLADGGSAHVDALLAGTSDRDRYSSASPIEMLPLGTPIVCVHGDDDRTVAPAHSIDFVAAAQQAGDDARLELIAGEHHRSALSPRSETWRIATEVVATLAALRSSR